MQAIQTETMKLGQLKRVDLRQAWAHEERKFTPWLASNLELLSDAIGISLELECVEKSVGAFRADILAKETRTGSWVIIENQLEQTDHNHLGQILTYAAGLKAVTIVWIATRFTDEHRAAINWLNEITDPTIRLFALELELWQIGNYYAPKFNVVSSPNVWQNKVNKGKHYIQYQKGELRDQVKDILRECPGISVRQLANRLKIPSSTAHWWRKTVAIEGMSESLL